MRIKWESMGINGDQRERESDGSFGIVMTMMTTSTDIPVPKPIPAAAVSADQTAADAADVPGRGRAIEFLLEELVDGEGDGLTGRDAHDARCDALVEGPRALLLEHVARDGQDARQGAPVGRRGWRLLQSRF